MSAGFPQFVSAGDILTDMVRTGGAHWTSLPGGAGWNVARAVARLGAPSACAGAVGRDCFSDELWRESEAAGLDLRFLQRVERAPLLAIVHETQPPRISSSARTAPISPSIRSGCPTAGAST